MARNDKPVSDKDIEKLKETIAVYESVFTNMCILIKTPEGIEVLKKMITNAVESRFNEIGQG